MALSIIEQAKKLTPSAAEKFCGEHGIEFHPLVCDSFARCVHVSAEQRREREASFKGETARPGVKPAVTIAAPEEPAEPLDETPDEPSEEKDEAEPKRSSKAPAKKK